MKLILINRYFYPDESATSRMLTSLAQSLSLAGWSVHVLASRSLHNDATVLLPDNGRFKGVTIHRLRTTTFGRGFLPGRAVDYATFHLAVMWQLLRLLRRNDVCVVCTDPPLLSVTAWLAAAARQAILVNWLLDLFPEIAMELGIGARQGAPMRVALWLRDLSLRHARINVVPMRRMSEYLDGRGIPASKQITINHWSDGDAIRPLDPEHNALRKEWGLGARFVVGYSGNFGRAHDFATFLDAAVRLREHDNIVFVFVGSGHQKDVIEAAVKEQALSNVILKPLQPRERLRDALALPDLHLISLLPAMEPFAVPSKLYGILAAGRPAVFVGDLTGEIATVLRTGDCGRSVTPGDSEGLADIILEFAGSPGMQTRMACNARKLFERRFTEATATSDWQRMLTESIEHAHGHISSAQSHDLVSR